MKRMISTVLTVLLIFTLTMNVFAASAVETAMYGDERAASADKSAEQITEDLKNQGIQDVTSTHWAAGAITVLVEEGFMKPADDGSFNPNSTATGSTTIAVFAKVLGIADMSDTTTQAVRKAQSSDLYTGKVPAVMTRLDVARLLANALGIKPAAKADTFSDTDSLSKEDRAILAALYTAGVFKGCGDGTFRPDEVITKAQLAVLVDRLLGTAGK